MIHSSLGIHSLLKKSPLKHNVIDRDKIVVPPNWDSWGKIRVLRDGFDVELVSNGWEIDLVEHSQTRPRRNGGITSEEHAQSDPSAEHNEAGEDEGEEEDEEGQEPDGSTVALYESSVKDPDMNALNTAGQTNRSTKLEVETMENQTFLAEQAKALEKYRQKEEESSREDPARSKLAKNGNYNSNNNRLSDDDEHGYYGSGGEKPAADAKVLEHIGPVQFNMGGIQVDADDMVQRLRVSLPFFFFFFFPCFVFSFPWSQHTLPLPVMNLSFPPILYEAKRADWLVQKLQERQTNSADGEDVLEDVPPMDTENLSEFFHKLMNRRGGPGK